MQQNLSSLGRQNPKKVKHRTSGGFQKQADFEMYSWEALLGDPICKANMTLEEAKAECRELRGQGCVGFMVYGKPSSWRKMDVHFMRKGETQKRERCYTFRFADESHENRLLSKIRRESIECSKLRALEDKSKRGKDQDVSHVVERGRSESAMHRLGQAVREADAQRQALLRAQRNRIEDLTTGKASASTAELDSCRSAVQRADRACQEVYQLQIFHEQPGTPAEEKHENKLLGKIRGELNDSIKLRALEDSIRAREMDNKRADTGPSVSKMQSLGKAVREVDAQRQLLHSAQRRRMEELRTTRKTSDIGPQSIPLVDLESCRAAVLEAERVCQDVYEQQIMQ